MGKHGNNDSGRREKGKADRYYSPKHASGQSQPLNYACKHENTVYIAGEYHCNGCGEKLG